MESKISLGELSLNPNIVWPYDTENSTNQFFYRYYIAGISSVTQLFSLTQCTNLNYKHSYSIILY